MPRPCSYHTASASCSRCWRFSVTGVGEEEGGRGWGGKKGVGEGEGVGRGEGRSREQNLRSLIHRRQTGHADKSRRNRDIL